MAEQFTKNSSVMRHLSRGGTVGWNRMQDTL